MEQPLIPLPEHIISNRREFMDPLKIILRNKKVMREAWAYMQLCAQRQAGGY